ncbi:branched-chain amino acid ABC transporter permease [Actinomadura welshii]
MLIQQIVDGLTSGALYAAMALSLVLVYRASGFLNFAQGEMATFGAFFTWQLTAWGLGLHLALGIAVLASFAGGALMERTLIRPLAARASHLALIIITLGVMLILLNAAGWIWGYNVKEVEPLVRGTAVELGPAVISGTALAVIVSVMVIAGLLWFLVQRTKVGLAMRALVNNPESADLIGLPVKTIVALSWGLAAAIGTLMCVLIAPQLYLQPGMLLHTLIYSFAAVVLGGLDSPVGAIAGGFIVGVVENLAGAYMPGIGSDFKQIVALAIIVLVLLFKSEGLFGTRQVLRV